MPDRHPDLLTRARSALFVVDVQERFREHVHGFDGMVAAIALLIRGASRLGVPVAYSEQYPEGLGHTVTELRDVLPSDAAGFEKLEISSCAAPGWQQVPAHVREREAVVVVGIEAHVCVAQTVLDLLHAGRRVHVPADAVASRDPWQRDAALERLARAGATVTTVEMALFELLGCAGSQEFKDVQRMIKEHDADIARRELEVVR